MPSLRDRQANFASGILTFDHVPGERIAIYHNTVFANYRNALGASYRIVSQLVGKAFFHAAVDAYVLDHPSTGGDLNVYGERFGDFLATYPHAQELAYLPDVARLEWAVDEASRAADPQGSPEALLAALGAIPAERVTAQRFALDPSCRFVLSTHPVLRIWQVHQPEFEGDAAVAFDGLIDRLLVRREGDGVTIERLPDGDFALLRALECGADLAHALDAAITADGLFDLGTTLRAFIANRTLTGLHAA